MPRLKFVSKVEGADNIELQEPIITIGRGLNNVVCIEDANISKHHVLLIAEDDTYRIFDLHSINGTSINGKRISTATVRIGYLDLSYEITPAVTAAPVAPAPPVAPVVAEPTPPPPAPPAPVTPKAPEPAAPVVAPAPTPAEPIAPAPAKRSLFGFGKRAPAPAPTPVPVTPPAPESVAPVVAAPTPAPAPAAPEPVAAPVEAAPTNAPAKKKFGAPPGGQNVKFKLKRE